MDIVAVILYLMYVCIYVECIYNQCMMYVCTNVCMYALLQKNVSVPVTMEPIRFGKETKDSFFTLFTVTTGNPL